MATDEPTKDGWVCPVYHCTLPRELHDPVEPGFECEPNSLWHGNELDAAYWPAPLEPAPYEPPAGHGEIYGPYEKRFQEQERARMLDWTRNDWLASVEDIDFQAHMLSSPVAFSGDLRPKLPSKEG